MARIVLILLAGLAATIIAARVAFELTSQAPVDLPPEPWSQGRLEFVTWNDEKWTAWIRDSGFEQIPCTNSRWSRHANPTLAFVDWEGEKWQAKVNGDEFLLAHRGDWQGAVERSGAIRYRDWTGRKQLRTVVDLRR